MKVEKDPWPQGGSFIRPAKRLGAVKEYYFSQKLRQLAAMKSRGLPVLNLGIGSPDLPPHPSVLAALEEAGREPGSHAYQSYRGHEKLRQAFVAWYARHFAVELDAETEVLPLIGSKEGLMHIAMTYLESGDEVLVPNPGYPAYRAVSELAGARVREYLLDADNGWLPDLSKLERLNLERVKLLWLNYPHMPTGARAERALFAELVEFAHRHRILLVHDNPYGFILNDRPLSLLSVPGAREVALELNSLSKSHNMAGWRIGMVAGRREFIDNLLRFKSNMDSGMFKPLQLAAAVALSLPPEWYSSLNAAYARRRALAWQLLEALGCPFDRKGAGMFVWAGVPRGYSDGFAFSDELLDAAHLFITPGGIFGSQGRRFVRLSLCSPEETFQEAIGRARAFASNRQPAPKPLDS